MKKTFLIFICVLLVIDIQAQTDSYMHVWGRMSISLPIRSTWRGEIELQHRRQNVFNDEIPLTWNHQLMNSARVWLHHSMSDGGKWSISPLAYFRHQPLWLSSEQIKPAITEYRISAAWEYKKALRKWLDISNRSALEMRMFERDYGNILRMRQRIGLNWKCASFVQLTAYYEVLLNTTGVDAQHRFDHDRVGCLMQFRPVTWIKLEGGYVHSHKLPKSADEIINEHNLIIHVYFELPIQHKS
jgi:hypothetical protein